MSVFLSDGATDHASTATPTACGQAIEVPLSSAKPWLSKPMLTVVFGVAFSDCPSTCVSMTVGGTSGTLSLVTAKLGANGVVGGTLSKRITAVAPAAFAF